MDCLGLYSETLCGFGSQNPENPSIFWAGQSGIEMRRPNLLSGTSHLAVSIVPGFRTSLNLPGFTINVRIIVDPNPIVDCQCHVTQDLN
jgi:hypothetical protein